MRFEKISQISLHIEMINPIETQQQQGLTLSEETLIIVLMKMLIIRNSQFVIRNSQFIIPNS